MTIGITAAQCPPGYFIEFINETTVGCGKDGSVLGERTQYQIESLSQPMLDQIKNNISTSDIFLIIISIISIIYIFNNLRVYFAGKIKNNNNSDDEDEGNDDDDDSDDVVRNNVAIGTATQITQNNLRRTIK